MKCYHYLTNIVSTVTGRCVCGVASNKTELKKLFKKNGYNVKVFYKCGTAREYTTEQIEIEQFKIFSKGLTERHFIIDINMTENDCLYRR